MIAVCIPTRGVVFTEVMQGVFDNVAGKPSRIFTTVDQGIPGCMTDLVERALEAEAEYIWIVEEDTVPPSGVLDRMLAADVDYIACDYPVMDGHTCFGFDDDGLLWTGFGCTLIRADVFRRLEKPWFDCDASAVLVRSNGLDYLTASARMDSDAGGQDISFCAKLKALGIQVHGLRDEECGHLRMRRWNTGSTNEACHTISSEPRIGIAWDEYVRRAQDVADGTDRAPEPLSAAGASRPGATLFLSRGIGFARARLRVLRGRLRDR